LDPIFLRLSEPSAVALYSGRAHGDLHLHGTGKRHTMTDSSETTTYNYDNMDRLTSKQTPEGTLSYTYDAAGNLASIAFSNANGASMSYSYDLLNRLSSVTDSRLGTTTYTYDGVQQQMAQQQKYDSRSAEAVAWIRVGQKISRERRVESLLSFSRTSLLHSIQRAARLHSLHTG